MGGIEESRVLNPYESESGREVDSKLMGSQLDGSVLVAKF